MDTKLLPPYVLTHFDSWAFCVIAFEPIELQTCSVPQNDRLDLSFVKDEHTDGEKRAQYGSKMTIYQLLFFES